MKKIVGLIVVFAIVGFFAYGATHRENQNSVVYSEKTTGSQEASPSMSKIQQSVFVPYWTLTAEQSMNQFDEAFYFGVAATREGIDTDEVGYGRISTFLEKTQGVKKRFLVIRMVDQELNSEILKDSNAQKNIANDAVSIAQSNGFDGIVLDFETAKISFDATTKRVTQLHHVFQKAAKQNKLAFYVTLYGDTYYRVRAYDVEKIGAMSDKVLLMAYDFHKARGNPGPNFPLRGKDKYGYDLTQMIEDFSRDVPTQKIQVIFGMFGYDWQVDKDGKSKENGQGLSTQEVTQRYITECRAEKCEWKTDSQSGETQVHYTQSADEPHVIWFENKDSVTRKQEYLKSRGITEFGYWAYSYFE